MVKFIPLGNRVLLKRDDEHNKDKFSAGGILIPEVAKEKLPTSTVIACGPGGRDESGKLIPMPVEVGDVVATPKYAGIEFAIEGEQFYTVRDDEILGKVIR